MASNVAEWMKDKTFFVTGASGFIGKMLVWKLLKMCPDLDAIYVLLRPKKGKTPEERLQELLSSEIFNNFKSTDPEILEKIRPIAGDMASKNLGINSSDRTLLQEKVNIIFNAAASVRFDDSLQKAVFTNTRSARDAIALAKGMKNLKAFVHISTAYTNSDHSYILEKVYEPPINPETMIKAAEKFSEQELEIYSKKILGAYLNTYIFSKNLAESIVYEERDKMPVLIYRPSIVCPSIEEPLPGWCDTFQGIFSISTGHEKGVLRVSASNPDLALSLLAADCCVNGMIASAWHRDCHLANSTSKIDSEITFNATDYQMTMRRMSDFSKARHHTEPFSNILWTLYVISVSFGPIFYFLHFLFHVVPGWMMDGCLMLMGKKPRLTKIYRRIFVAFSNLAPFTSFEWNFETDNFKKLSKILSKEDQDKLPMFALRGKRTIDDAFEICRNGARRLFGDPPTPSKGDKDRAHRLYWIDRVLRLVLLGIFISFLPLQRISEQVLSYWSN